MPRFGNGRSDVPSAWAAALEQLLEAMDPTHMVAEFVLTGLPAGALKNAANGFQWPGTFHWHTPAAQRAADPAATVSPPETLLRSLFLVQRIEQALT